MAAVRIGDPGAIAGAHPNVGITGHRDLSGGSQRWAQQQLTRVLGKLRDQHDTRMLRCGMAIGADLIAAEVAAHLGIGLWAYVPYPQQADGWPRHWAARRQMALDRADGVTVVGEANSRAQRVRLLHARNRAIVDDADLLVAVWDRRGTGGTAATVRRAHASALPIVVVDPAARTVTARPPVPATT